MKKKKPIPLNPIRKPGPRNLACPFYGACLDYVVARRWKHWSCSECAYKEVVHELAVPVRYDYDPYEERPDPRGVI